MLARLKFKIDGLVNEMLDQLPDEVWINSTVTFLDPAMAGGQFLKEVVRRLRAAGHADENISGRVFGVAEDEIDLNYAIKNAKLIGKYDIGGYDFDYESEFGLKKFDVIVGNPPYQVPKESNPLESKPIWGDMLHKMSSLMKSNGYMAVICPNRWLLPEAAKGFWKKIIKNGSLLWVNSGECSKHFNVGRGPKYFGSFVFSSAKLKQPTKLVYISEKMELDVSTLDFLPTDISKIGMNIFIKLMQVGKLNGRWNFQRGKRELTVNQPKVGYGHAQHGADYEKLLMIDINGTDDFSIKSNDYTWVALPAGFISESVETLFNSKLYKWYASSTTDGDFSTSVQKYIPKLDVTTKLTNKNIYDYFGLTEEEIVYIEEIIK